MTTDHKPEHVDPERPEPRFPFDNLSGYSGQDLNKADAERLNAEEPRGRVDPKSEPRTGPPKDTDPRDIPPDNGVRAYFDPDTGEVHGSGSPNEGFDTGMAGEPRSTPGND